VPLISRELHGTILLGKKPLAAKLLFGGEFGSQVLPTESDEEGHFRVRLPNPEAKAWNVTVNAPAPRVKRTLRITLPEKADEELEIRLKDTIVFGTVVDEAGKPVGPEVGVNMTHAEEVIQGDVAGDGSFAFHGVEPGPYTVQAEGYLVESDAVPVAVPEDGMTDGLRLVVRPVRKIIGRVSSSIGPVPGARVQVVPADVPALFAAFRDTDERGEFSTVVPWNCQRIDVYVAAPGFSYRAFRTTIREGSMLNVPVDQRGGVLTARWPKGTGAAVLFHTGAMLWPDSLVWECGGRRQSVGDSEELIAAPLDPGLYTLCVIPPADVATLRLAPPLNDARCSDAFLPPFGEVTIERGASTGGAQR
jgi:hypothetical protein